MSKTSNRGTWRSLAKDRTILSWSLYDWANSAFATTVMAGFFPIFFKTYSSAGADANLSTYQLGNANSLASAILAVTSPVLGAIADQGSHKKRLLFVFAALGIVMTGALSLVAKGDWQSAIFIYVVASIGFAGSNSFYDSLLVFVSKPRDRDTVSAMGFALGYLGGGVLFALNVVMLLKPGLFGIADKAQAVKASFVSVSLWWALFSLPLLFFVREPPRPSPSYWRLAVDGLKQIVKTFEEIRKLRMTFLFLIAYFFYIDGVGTIMKMAVDYGLSLGFPSESLIVALLITQFVAFPSTLGFGGLARKLGAKTLLYVAIGVYMAVTCYSYFMQSPWQFYVLAVAIGMVQGGIQALSRSAFSNMIPQDKSGEFFGFFNMLGKFASVMGPWLVGLVSVTTRDSRLAILSILILFGIGAVALAFVKIPALEDE